MARYSNLISIFIFGYMTLMWIVLQSVERGLCDDINQPNSNKAMADLRNSKPQVNRAGNPDYPQSTIRPGDSASLDLKKGTVDSDVDADEESYTSALFRDNISSLSLLHRAANTSDENNDVKYTSGFVHIEANKYFTGSQMPGASLIKDNSLSVTNNPVEIQQKGPSTMQGKIDMFDRSPSDEEVLMDYLLRNYNPSARPVLKGSDTVTIYMQFSLMHIKDLDVKSQILTTTGLLILEWTDERLTWNPEEHNNLHEIIIEIEKLWKPEFAVINGAEEIYSEYNQFRAVINKNGTVHWEPGGVFKTMCEIDITYYPFDSQECKLTFGAWTYHTGKMNMSNMEQKVNNDSYKSNGEWTITDTLVKRDEFKFGNMPNEAFAFIDFIIQLRRRHTFYILNVILPSIMTSVLLLSIFFCTPAQKVQIGVVVLLSFRIFLLNVADNIPKTSDHIPLLGIYLTCTMAITTLSMVLTVVILNLHHITDKPIPNFFRSCVFITLARLMGLCGAANYLIQKPDSKTEKEKQYDSSNRYDFEDDEDENYHQQLRAPLSHNRQTFMNNIYSTSASGSGGAGSLSISGGKKSRGGGINNRTQSSDICSGCLEEKAAMIAESTANSKLLMSPSDNSCSNNHQVVDPATHYGVGGGAFDEHLGDNIDFTQYDSRKYQLYLEEEKIKEQNKADDNAKDWKEVAQILDRFFFWLFLLAIVITTLILFLPLISPDVFNTNVKKEE